MTEPTFPTSGKWLTCGGAKGTRTPNPLLAKQVRYQLRHGPRSGTGPGLGSGLCLRAAPGQRPGPGQARAREWGADVVRGLVPQLLLGLLLTCLLAEEEDADDGSDDEREHASTWLDSSR